MKHSVLLDTSFFIRLLNDGDSLHKNALGYFKYFLEKEIVHKVSTISVAEYCVLGKLEDLPLKNIQILPFNLKDAERTGEFAGIIFNENKISEFIRNKACSKKDGGTSFQRRDLKIRILFRFGE